VERRATGICSLASKENLLGYSIIYLEELAQTISNKKYLFKAISNQKQIEQKLDRNKTHKATIIA
jgi:hypothetical protein